MDWQNVSIHELCRGIQETDWGKPRPVAEFLGQGQGFAPPKGYKKLISRLKSNVYYYRANYVALFIVGYAIPFIRNPLALVALGLTALSVLVTNDNFATSLNDSLLRLIRKVHPSTALKLRARANAGQPDGSLGARKHSRRSRMYILLAPRWFLVGLLTAIAGVLVRLSCAWSTFALGTLLGVGLPVLHATFRCPNLKVKLTNAREEFRTVWRGYQMEMSASLGMGSGYDHGGSSFHDYTQ